MNRASEDSEALATPDDGDQRRHRRPVDWRGQLASVLTGVAGGMAVNVFSGTLGYRGLAGAFAVAAVVSASVWLRRLDARAWLPRYARWLFLVPAGVAAILAVSVSGPVAAVATAVAALLTLGAVLSATGMEGASRLLFAVAALGVGVAAIGIGATMLADRDLPYGVAAIAFGMAAIVFGTAVLADRAALAGVALIGLAVAFSGVGMAVLADRAALRGVAAFGGGMALIGLGVAVIGPTTIRSSTRRLMDSATKAPENRPH